MIILLKLLRIALMHETYDYQVPNTTRERSSKSLLQRICSPAWEGRTAVIKIMYFFISPLLVCFVPFYLWLMTDTAESSAFQFSKLTWRFRSD